ncbi:hypothetical protein GALMADRAFT_1341890, partial [Galerina marginata CBS 339.88]
LNFAIELRKQFNESGNVDNLQTAEPLLRKVLKEFPGGSESYAMAVDNLGWVLQTRFHQTGQRSDLNEAIQSYEQSLELRPPPHPDRFSSLDSLGNALTTRFQQTSQQSDIDAAVSWYRQALENLSQLHPYRSNSLNNLATALWTRFEHSGQQADLEEAISLHKQVLERLPPLHPDRPRFLNNLSNALSTQFQRKGQINDLNEAILLQGQALEFDLDPGRPHRPRRSIFLNGMAILLWTRFKQEGKQDDLDEAVSLHRQAFELRPSPHPMRLESLTNLAVALSTKYKQEGQQRDLDEMMLLSREALNIVPLSHHSRPRIFSSLASILLARFEVSGRQSDLDEAILSHRKALELRPPSDPHRYISLTSLAQVLHTQFEHGGQRSDLQEAILLGRKALDLLSAAHPDRSSTLNSLAISLLTQFKLEGQQCDLEEAILLHTEALQLRPPPHPLRSQSLNNLANAVGSFTRSGDRKSNLAEAISLYRKALEIIPPGPLQSSPLYNLAVALVKAYLLDKSDTNLLEEAMSYFIFATNCDPQPASLRLTIAKKWIECANISHHATAIEAYDVALRTLPRLAALNLDLQSRQEALTSGSDGLARDASRCAIKAGRLDKAIEFLETGRTIFWSQILSLRSPFDHLHDIAPDLADQLRDLTAALERGSHRDISPHSVDNFINLSIDQETSRMNLIHEKWLKAIDEVREIQGFEDFLRPRQLSSLQGAASEFPVVVLVGTDFTSHCLIMRSTEIHYIPLPRLSAQVLRKLGCLLQAATSHSTIQRSFLDQFSLDDASFSPAITETLRGWGDLEESRGMRYENSVSSDAIFRSVLKTLWNEVVKPVIDFIGFQARFKKSEEPAMLKWCPTGLFSFFPLHAAGCYDDVGSAECASDYIISSYTPTIGLLLPVAPKAHSSTQKFEILAIADTKRLSSAGKEVKVIERHLSNPESLVQLGTSGHNPGNVDKILSHLSSASIVHFACHGKQDQSTPLNSALLVEDGPLTISKIMQQPLPHGSLAFLCACETAMGDANLPDEAMSLGASLLFSGFRSVIATMWEIQDKDGPTIADAFYEQIFRGAGGQPGSSVDTGKYPQALHIAVKKLRSTGVSFRRWVPFIHMGK